MKKESNEGIQRKVYNKIFNGIIRGSYAPGEKISIRALSAKMGTSVTPVREALLKLEAQGAIHSSSTGVLSIPKRSVGEIEQLYAARILVEGQLTAEAALHMSDATLEKLKTIDRKTGEISHSELNKAVSLNEEFHMAIYQQANNPVLMELANHLWLQCGPLLPTVYAFHKVISEHIKFDYLKESGHSRMVECFAAKDADGAKAAMISDIESGLNVYRAVAVDFEKAISEVHKSIAH